MNRLKLIITTEYLTDVRSKAFWISTILMPLVMVGFGVFVGFLSAQSDVMNDVSRSTSPDFGDDITGWDVLGLLTGLMLTLCIMINGSMIFNKVKVEKCNRIVEILSTCVDGRTMMLAKVVSVFLVSLTQLALWFVIIAGIGGAFLSVLVSEIPFDVFLSFRFWSAILWSFLFFSGGYVFYGSLYAACGALTDKNNENQEYMTILTFVLLAALYIGMYAVDNPDGAFSTWCAYIPFTSPTVATVRVVAGSVPFWQSALSLVLLYAFAWIAISFAGKIYRSALLLTGKKFSVMDIVTFLKAK